jgi:serine/threonine protein kinase/tetratricopeptide (TPR) repeat protein
VNDAGSPEHWRRAHDLVDELLDLPVGEREAHLQAHCGNDAALADDVRRWLVACDHESGFLDRPPAFLATLIGSLPASTTHEPGTHIGPYRLLSVAGAGGMGTVYLAERDDGEFTRRVALKLMRAMAGDGALLTRRFRAERQILASLEHPNIARLLDGGLTSDGIPYYVMEFVEGKPLDRYVAERNLSVRERLRLFRQVAAAVRFAHQRLVVHRDLKPSNILVTDAGDVKLVDFGIAKVLDQRADDSGPQLAGPQTLTGVLGPVMTPEYASPEQFRGEAITVASDVYSLGVVLYQLLTDHLPFKRGRSLGELEDAVTSRDPARPSELAGRRELRGDLDTIILTALRKDPARRYGSVEAFDADIARHLDGLPVSARPDTVGYRLGKFVTRHRWPVLAAAIVAVLLTWSNLNARQQSARATREAARATEVSRFLVSLLTVPYQYDPDDRTLSMRGVLDSAAARLTGDMAEQARDQPELLEALAMGYYGMGVYAEAVRLQRLGMEARAGRGEERGNVEDSRSMLGEMSMALGDIETARSSYDTVVEYYRRKYSDTSQWVGTFSVGRGSAQRAQGEVRLAESTFIKARDNLKQHLPDRLLPLANSLTNLGHTYLELGELDLGEAAYREAIAVRRQARASPIELAHAHGNLGRLLVVQGRFTEADSFLTEAERIMRTGIEEAHPQMTPLIGHRAFMALLQGDPRTALRLAQQALSRQEKEEGLDHPRLAPTLLVVGDASLALGDRNGARRRYSQALELLRSRERRPSPRQAEAIMGLGLVNLAEGSTAEGRTLLEQAREILTGVVDPGDRRLARIEAALASSPAEP